MCDELMELTDKKFLSTPSARRATRSRQITQALPADFYPRPPRGGRPRADCRRPTPNTYFYPRPPRGGRLLGPVAPGRTKKFLSTPSARRATCRSLLPMRNHHNFYPRPPRGGRHMSKYGTNGSGIFLSTPSARRATSFSMRLRLPTRNFYPRPPRGGRHDLRAGQGPRSEISIHALREEGDGSQPDALTVQTISIHALREEGDTTPKRSSCC